MSFRSLCALKILYIASGCKLLWFHSSFGLQDSISFHFSLFHICAACERISKMCNSENSVYSLQGGLYVFKGKQLVFARKDEGTGDHASLDDVLNVCCSPALV